MRFDLAFVLGLALGSMLACSDGDETFDASGGASSTSPSAGPTGSTGAAGSTATSGGSSAGGSNAGGGGSGGAASVPAFGSPMPLSDAANTAFVPSVAARTGQALVAWHEFDGADVHIAYVLVKAGVPGQVDIVADPFTMAESPWVAVTTSGYVVAYQANDGTTDVIRAVEIDATGAVVKGPDTISATGSSAVTARVSTSGDEEAFSWTDGTKHSFAMRGPLETVPPTDVGTTLLSQGTLNFPRIALAPSGELYLAYRDGGEDSSDWDVLLVTRPHAGTFGPPTNVSKSAGLLSDDISLALEADGTLDLAWVDQDQSGNSFEVEYASRTSTGTFSAPKRYGTQNLWCWTPSVIPGLDAIWYSGPSGAFGPYWYGAPGVPPTSILGTVQGSRPSFARGPDGALHLAFGDNETPSRIQYVESP